MKLLKNLPLLIAAGMLLIGTSASAEKSFNVRMKIAGSLINQVQMLNPDGSPAAPAVLIFGSSIGSPGSAAIQVVSRLGPPTFSLDCFEGAGGLLFPVVTNDLAATFLDQSMFAATLDEGFACISTTTGESHTEISLLVNGGWGRFDGASGELDVVVDTMPNGANMSIETGTIRGEIVTP